MGSPHFLGAVLLRRLLRAGHRVTATDKLIFRKDVVCVDVLNIIGHQNLCVLSEERNDISALSEREHVCDIIYYFTLSPDPADNPEEESDLLALISKASTVGVKRFICVTYAPEGKGAEIQSLTEKMAADFSVILVDLSALFGRSLTKRFTIAVEIFSGQRHSVRRISLNAGRQAKDYTVRYVMPGGWYGSKDEKPFKNLSQGVAAVSLFLGECALELLHSNGWPRKISREIAIEQSRLLSKLPFLSKNPSLPGIGYLKNTFLTLHRLFDVLMLMFLIQVRPDQAYRFSTRKCLPSPSERFKLEEKPVVPFKLVESRTKGMSPLKEVHLVMRGTSFNLQRLEELNGPVFLVSFWEPIETKKDVIYLMGRAKACLRLARLGYHVVCTEVLSPDRNGDLRPNDQDHRQDWYNKFKSENLCPWISLEENLYASYGPNLWTPTGSALPAICALYPFAEKMNIYGWDFYLNTFGNELTEQQLYSKLYNLRLDITRSRNHVESALYNFYYAYHFSRMPNIKIHSYLGQLDKHEKLMKKIERVLFNA
jgi:hypothetical protein